MARDSKSIKNVTELLQEVRRYSFWQSVSACTMIAFMALNIIGVLDGTLKLQLLPKSAFIAFAIFSMLVSVTGGSVFVLATLGKARVELRIARLPLMERIRSASPD